ncbi:acetyltransferase family protein [Paraburkholderia xenovorans LB400]|uniref:Acetyltransferase n=1 Tax=Paraburkholderia xenovorans (strain LB400) TaxID=266265 RepID=Q13H41_PARXL|nr:GNAT family N-acetyltransferase [Paraburkholderia xenovorans]ABE36598.1 Putative acetyltransferase [Paraburkholderia xenovorans LB400]AIP34117.1 acetyltransferase family protein [Paraburkholderia xenovorans LB400]
MSDPTTHALFTCRRLSPDDIPAAQRLSAAIGWPHRREEWRFSARTGIGFVAEMAGALVGTVVCWMFGSDRATLGMLLVAPEHRGKGIGEALFARALDELGERDITLYASDAARPLCEALGFEACGALDQMQGAAFRPPLVALPTNERLRPLGARDTAQLVALASRASGLDRSLVLPPLLDLADGIALDRDGELLGFSLFRRFGRGFIIGPVVAGDAPDGVHAKALIRHWLALNEGALIRIDAPHGHGLDAWLSGLGIVRTETVVKMRRLADATRRRETDIADGALHQYAVIMQSLA